MRKTLIVSVAVLVVAVVVAVVMVSRNNTVSNPQNTQISLETNLTQIGFSESRYCYNLTVTNPFNYTVYNAYVVFPDSTWNFGNLTAYSSLTVSLKNVPNIDGQTFNAYGYTLP